MTKFSILIPTWKNLPYLELAYRGIRAHSAAEHEVIVFFNECDDACRAWAGNNDVKWLEAPDNRGVCEAVNRAARLATTDFICFMNDDMFPLPGWDTALAQYLGMADPLWLSGTAIEPGRATACYIGECDYGSTPETLDEERLLREFRRHLRPYNVVSTWTPTLIARKDWEAVDGFDERYFPGHGSDPDLAMKLFCHGCRRFVGVGSSLVYHFSRATTSRFDTVAIGDDVALFRRKWGMSRGRFLRRVLRRGELVTPALMRKADRLDSPAGVPRDVPSRGAKHE